MSDHNKREKTPAAPKAMGQLSADDPSKIGTTIVGGQPPGHHRKSVAGVPVGIERVLYAAAVDPAFKARLFSEREAAVQERGFTLSESELAMLRLAPAAQLESAIAGLDTSEHNLKRRNFMRAVAASAAGLIVTDTLGGCIPTSTGSRPDPDRGFDAGGIRPDLQADARPDDLEVEIDNGVADRGIRPDGGE